MKQTTTRLVIALTALSALAGCGKQSRFDEATDVDVCGIVSRADAEHILGPLTRQAFVQGHSGNAAGACTWSFKPTSGRNDATMSVTLITHGSQHGAVTFDPWSKVGLGDTEANLDPHPSDVADLGDKALLFQTPQPSLSEIEMQQSRTYAVLLINGGSPTQLVDFARLVSRGIETR